MRGGACRALRAEVAGRSGEVFRYGDVEIHPIVIDTVLVKIAAIIEYQVRQTANGVDIALVVDGDVDEAALAAAIKQSLSDAGLVNPTATVRVVSALERHPQSGKVRRFVSIVEEK